MSLKFTENPQITTGLRFTASSPIGLRISSNANVSLSISSGGDLDGPATATDNAIALFDGNSGKLLQNSGVLIDDSNNIASPGSITLTSSGFGYGYLTSQTLSGTLTTNQYFANKIGILDSADASGTALNSVLGLWIAHQFGGSTVKGSRAALQAQAILNGATNAANTNRNYVGVAAYSQAATGDGGTNTGAGALGGVFGLNVGAETTAAAATNLESLIGIEVDVNALAGSSMRNKIGVLIVQNAGATAQGASRDAGIAFSNSAGTPGWKDGILFDSGVSTPMDVTGVLLRTLGGFTVDRGIDLTGSVVSSAAFKSPGFMVTGLGAVYAGTTTTIGGVQAGDIVSVRSATTGSLFFGTAGNRYLHYDGTTYLLNAVGLALRGAAASGATSGDLTVSRSATTGAIFFDTAGSRYIYNDGTTFEFAGCGIKFATQALSGAGAINLTSLTTKWTTTGADAGTLADGTEGQLKYVVMIVDGGDGTLTPSNLANGTTLTFAEVGDAVMLQFLGTEWWVISNNGVVLA